MGALVIDGNVGSVAMTVKVTTAPHTPGSFVTVMSGGHWIVGPVAPRIARILPLITRSIAQSSSASPSGPPTQRPAGSPAAEPPNKLIDGVSNRKKPKKESKTPLK